MHKLIAMPTLLNPKDLQQTVFLPALSKHKVKQITQVLKIIAAMAVFGYFITLAVTTNSPMLQPLIVASIIILLLIARLSIYRTK